MPELPEVETIRLGLLSMLPGLIITSVEVETPKSFPNDPEVDSYGIGVENDGRTLTQGWDVFQQIADMLKSLGCEQVIINGGGLATNFCAEFSLNNTDDFLAGHFKMRGMKVRLNFVPEISRGIPIPGGIETPFSLAGTVERLRARRIEEISVNEILALRPRTPDQTPTPRHPAPAAA